MDVVTLGAALNGSKKYTDQVGQSLESNLSSKANVSDVNTATANLQTQINQIAQAAGTGSADTEVAQARVGADGTSYQTLKARLDSENSELKEDLSDLQDAVGIEYISVPTTMLDYGKLNPVIGNVFSLDTDEKYHHVEVEIDGTRKFRINLRQAAPSDYYKYICAVDSNNIIVFAAGEPQTTSGYYTYDIEVPETAVKLIATHYGSGITTVEEKRITNVQENIERIDSNVSNIVDSINRLSGESQLVELPLNTDLNTFTTRGVFYTRSRSGTASITNCPFTSGTMKLFVFTFDNENNVTQLILHTTGVTAIRSQASGGTIWRDWIVSNNKKFSSFISSVVYGDNISPQIETWNGTDAQYNNGWNVNAGGKIQTNITVESGKTYYISLDVSNALTEPDVLNPVRISLGNESIEIFAANDANWQVALTPSISGAVNISVESVQNWTGKINNIVCKPVNELMDSPIKVNSYGIHSHSTNVSLGGHNKLIEGNRNTGFGSEAQASVNTATWNAAFGTNAQRRLTNGRGNNAVGNEAQSSLTTGCYNNAFGTSAQSKITTGLWNNAFGNEAQRDNESGCNNVAIGRRSQNSLNGGHYNTSVGSQSSFAPGDFNSTSDANATITASFQTVIGGRAGQSSPVQADNLTVVGFSAQGTTNSTAVGAKAKAKAVNSIAIGYQTETEIANEIKIGNNTHTSVKIAGKIIHFNVDGTVTWENETN